MFYLTIVCALVSAAALVVGLACLTSTRRLQRNFTRLWEYYEQLQINARRSETSALRVEVDDLTAGLDKLRRSVHKRFGTVWAEIGLQPDPDDAGAALSRSEDPRARLVGDTLTAMGIGRVPPGTVCACGWCQSCVERKLAAGHGGQ